MKSRLFSNTFLKYLLSYIFAFLIPLLFTFVFIYNYVFNIYKNEVLNNEKSQNIIFRDIMDIQVKQLYNMAEQISIEDEFKTFYNISAFNRMTSYKKLFGYDFANSLVSNIAYVQSNIDTVVTSRGTCQKDNLSNFLIKYKQWPLDKMLGDLFSYKNTAWRPFEEITFEYVNKGRYMTFIYPLTPSESDVKSVLLFNIKEEDFLKILNINKANEKNGYIILDNSGAVFYSSITVSRNIEDLLSYVVSNTLNDVQQIEGERYFISFSKSNFNNFTYVNVLPVKTALEKVSKLQKIVFILFIITVLIGVILICFFMNINYNPIKNLKCYIDSNFSKIPGVDNEIETAKITMSMLAESSNRMQEKIDSSKRAVKSIMLYELLWGDYLNIREFNSFGKDYGIQITGSSFCIVVFRTNNDIRSLEKNDHKMIRYIEIELKELHCFYGLENLERNSLVFILSLDGINKSELENLLISLRDKINRIFLTEISIGLSGICRPEDNIYNLYIEAIAAIEHYADMPIKIGKGITQFGESNLNVSLDYPAEDIEKLQSTIISYDVDSFNTISMYLLNYLKNSNISNFVAIRILYDMINFISKALSKINKEDYKELFGNIQISPEKYNNITDLEELVKNICYEVSMYLRSKTVSDTQVEKIKQYITQHFNEYDFSLQILADNFNMSLSSIGQYFKKNTGITLSEYLSNLKFDEAKRMLRNTNLKIEEIIERIGYVSISSFIRRFKQDIKMTPGEYRQYCQNMNTKDYTSRL